MANWKRFHNDLSFASLVGSEDSPMNKYLPKEEEDLYIAQSSASMKELGFTGEDDNDWYNIFPHLKPLPCRQYGNNHIRDYNNYDMPQNCDV
jgi:hypothetical protein